MRKARKPTRRAVVVLGMHRSGTSAVARCLSLLGLELPRSPMAPNEANPLGHWGESTELYDIHEELLEAAGSAWDDVEPFPADWRRSPDGERFRARLAGVVRSEYPGNGPIVLKDPRICRLLALWLDVLDDVGVAPGFVIPVRNPLEVAASLERRDGFPVGKGLLLWLRHVLDAEQGSRGHERVFLSYPRLLKDWRREMATVRGALDLAWPRSPDEAAAEIERYLAPGERHHRFSRSDLRAREDVVGWVAEAHSLLRDAARKSREPDVRKLDRVREEVDEAHRAYGPVLADERRAGAELRHELDAEAAAARANAQRLSRRVAALQAERSEWHAARAALEDRLAEAERAAAEAKAERDLGVGPRLRRRWTRRRARAAQRRRALRQLATWVLKPGSVGRPRNVREYLALRRSPYFDRERYLRENPDVAEAGMDPVLHYVEHGARANLDPGPSFSTARYRTAHPELTESGVNPLYHFIRERRRSGTAPDRDAPVSFAAAGPPRAAADGDERAARARGVLADRPLSVSVVVPTHNRVGVLGSALRSALDQSHPPHEVIVGDDGSTDGTEAMLRSEFGPDLAAGRLRYLRLERQSGTAAARNLALGAATADVVAYLDSDNEWHPDFLLRMTAALAENPDRSTAYCGYVRFEGPGTAPAPRFYEYERERLLVRNFVDLNTFVHRRRVSDQLGGFDENLTRLVDWELVLRYTRRYPPVTVPAHLVNYDAGTVGDRVTNTEDFEANAAAIRRHFARELIPAGAAPLRIAYALWDYPAASQTFVLNEIRHLARRGYDVNVYFHADPDRAAALDFDVPTFRVNDAEELATLVKEHGRTVLHSHFAYPAATRLAWPAANRAGIPFTFMVHAVDVFHRANRERNRIAEMAGDPLCSRVFAIGEFHRSFLREQGVPADRISVARPAGALRPAPADVVEQRLRRARRVVATIARFVDKKGIDDLIRAAPLLPAGIEVRLYGYGPQEGRLREVAAEHAAANVTFAGPLAGAEAVDAALAGADVFALPCTVDDNGDMDGLPTVIGEAMAAGVPVVTTGIGAIGEVVEDGQTGFLVPARDPRALAARIADVLEMEADALAAVLSAARDRAVRTWSVERTVDALLEVWEQPPLDIVMVTHGRDAGAAEALTTTEIVRRLYEFTTTDFNLTIVDNASDERYREALQRAVSGRANAALVLLDENIQWGPAMNVALENGRGRYVVYVCSREGFVLRPGWERHYVEHLRERDDVAIAGHLISSPAYPDGAGYLRQPWFEGFRNRGFAEERTGRAFDHVQGGLFGLRRAAYDASGGFSEKVSQDAVDVEYSYFLESLGWKLGRVEGIPSVTQKTRPKLHAHLDEHTVAAHPLALDSVDIAASVAAGRDAFCNVCSWHGERFAAAGACPDCGSTPLGRLVYRYLASTALPFRGLGCGALLDDPPVEAELERMFRLEAIHPGEREGSGRRDVLIADLAKLPDRGLAASLAASELGAGGVAILGSSRGNGDAGLGPALDAKLREGGFSTTRLRIVSAAVGFPAEGALVAVRGDPTREAAHV
jgi:glycosyltransferase involved in cell wall biosynthesis